MIFSIPILQMRKQRERVAQEHIASECQSQDCKLMQSGSGVCALHHDAMLPLIA